MSEWQSTPIKDNQVKCLIPGHGMFIGNTEQMSRILAASAEMTTPQLLGFLIHYYGEELLGWDEMNRFELLMVLADLGWMFHSE